MSQSKPAINVKSKMKYKEEYNQYTFQLCHKRNYWWLLLLLLPLLLFIKCSKDITVTCMDVEGDFPIVSHPVKLDYSAHYLYNDGIFFASDSISLIQETDSIGCTTFEDLPCSVFSYLFYCLQEVTFSTESECYKPIKENRNFHYNRNVTLEMEPYRKDLYVKLLDRETRDALPDGKLIYKYIDNGEVKIDSVEADAAGVVRIPQMRYCSSMTEIIGCCYGYEDEIRKDVLNKDLVSVSDSTALLLRPIMERFTFYVKNKVTKQPIPEALCNVLLTHPGSSKQVSKRQITTSIDGMGIAVYDSAFVLSVIDIQACKTNYYDGKLEGGPWTVEKFIKQDEDTRTVWLTPKPYVQEFINVDSINGRPICGVENKIRITSPDGQTTTITEISNRNGVFPIRATEDDKIEIISTKRDEYVPKQTVIPVFKDSGDKKVKMQPELDSIKFRTVVEDGSQVLPNCHLTVTGSISGNLPPSNSGNGVFTVNMRKVESLSIVAYKSGYAPNTTKVRNAPYNELVTSSQSQRDIPLIKVPPCGGGKNVPKAANEVHHVATYGMGQMSGTTTIWVDFYGEADMLTVYDGSKPQGTPLFGQTVIANQMTIPIHFTQGAVTVVIDTSSDTSSWQYVVNCP